MTNRAFRHNHYVPRWYQELFLPVDRHQRELFYLDKSERTIRDGKGRRRALPQVSRKPLKKCFAQDDLYTLSFGGISNTDLERNFFGEIDNKGRQGVLYWGNYAWPSVDGDAVLKLLTFMSTQKLRTPKGLDWLAATLGTRDPLAILGAVVQYRTFFNALWVECVWQLADASAAATKFIVSDHPVTVYNRAHPPQHPECRRSGDPPIHLQGTHTIFPLSLDKVLILTNRSWAINPYGAPEAERPYPVYARDAVFNFTQIQLERKLDELEVVAINSIIKSRAYRYVAAAEEDWLYPERQLPKKTKWSRLGGQYLLMPDPRSLNRGGEMYLSFAGGGSMAMDAYGRPGPHPDFGSNSLPPPGRDPLERFKGEFARMFGPTRRGRRSLYEKSETDTESRHEYHLSLDRRASKRHSKPTISNKKRSRKKKRR